MLRRGHARLGEIFCFRLAGRGVTASLGPRAHAAFFRARRSQLSAREVYQFTVPDLRPGRRLRRAAGDPRPADRPLFPALRDERLRTYARVMREEVEAYVEAWGDEGEVDLLVALNELTVFIASRCLIGEEFRRRSRRSSPTSTTTSRGASTSSRSSTPTCRCPRSGGATARGPGSPR